LGPKTKIEIFLTLIIVLLLGCASQQTADESMSESNRISNLTIKIEPEAIILKIEGKLALTYTAEKQVLPMGVVLQFPDTQLELARRIYLPPDNEIISSIKADEKIEGKKTTARIFIAFKKDASYKLAADEDGLAVTFPLTSALASAPLKDAEPQSKIVEKKPEPEQKSEPEVIPENRPTANYLKTVTATPLENKIAVEVKADTTINDYKSFILDRPPRIVFDLYNLKSPYKKEQTVSVASPWVKRIRHFAHPDRVRLVLETHKSYLSKYSALPNDTGLLIHVGNTHAASNKASQTASDATSGTQKAKLTWEEVPNATAYNVYWSSSPGVTRHNGNKIANVQSPVTIKNLKSGLTYYFVVTTVKGSKESPESEEFSYTPGE
jgi:type IV pilus assembly protein PilQ